MSSEWTDPRPMSPHLQVWRWHGAMMSSILHRASAIICYVALLIVGLGLLVIGLTGELPLAALVFSPLGAIGLFVFLFAFIFMALAQLRHAIWDRGDLFDPQLNNTLSYVMIVVAVILAVGLTFGGIAGLELA
ncbi:MAG: succinate dehydrogenase, cytochrome b556 subunit [Pseudomonadota bacterium]